MALNVLELSLAIIERPKHGGFPGGAAIYSFHVTSFRLGGKRDCRRLNCTRRADVILTDRIYEFLCAFQQFRPIQDV